MEKTIKSLQKVFKMSRKDLAEWSAKQRIDSALTVQQLIGLLKNLPQAARVSFKDFSDEFHPLLAEHISTFPRTMRVTVPMGIFKMPLREETEAVTIAGFPSDLF